MELYLDIRTLSFVVGLISVLLAATLVYTQATSKTYPGFSSWTIGYVFNAMGMLLLSSRHLLPNVLSIIAANTLITAFVILCDRGISKFYAQKPRILFHTIVITIQIITFIFFTYVSPKVTARILIISALLTVTASHSLYNLFRYARGPQKGKQTILKFSYMIFTLWFFVRTVMTAISKPMIIDFMTAGTFQALAFISMIVTTILGTIGFIMLNHHRLENDLKASDNKIDSLAKLLPICSNCHKVRDDNGYWGSVEEYIQDHSEIDFSHSICPQCSAELYPDLEEDE